MDDSSRTVADSPRLAAHFDKWQQQHRAKALKAKQELPSLKAAVDKLGDKYQRLHTKVHHHRDAERPESSRAHAVSPSMRAQLDEAKRRLTGVNTAVALTRRRDRAKRAYMTAYNKWRKALKIIEMLDTGELD